jgi:alkanesulfonate monooxygenase SsuD/methylene tetrahydromethanopterin reductase-like flavin-dependent oxidoreductase (luciferase family)
MKIGVLQFFSWPERRVPLQTVYARALERIEIMDRGGFDAVWLAEHHFNAFSVCPSVHMMGTLAAARTRRLRIGTAVSLAAFYHPLRLAEEVALLDVLSGGRVNWGAGRGFDRTEFEVFGVSAEESASRFREAVDVVLRAWSEQRLTYQGKYFHFEDVEVLPKPLQQPHPPVWVAASSEPAVEWAAEHGLSILMDPHAAHGHIARKRRLYEERLIGSGFSMAGREIPMARLVAVAETHGEAEAVARRGARWVLDSYAGPRHAAVLPFGSPVQAMPVDPVERYLGEVVVYGSPAEVVDKFWRLREEMQLEYLLCAPLSHASFMLLAEEVLPRVATV